MRTHRLPQQRDEDHHDVAVDREDELVVDRHHEADLVRDAGRLKHGDEVQDRLLRQRGAGALDHCVDRLVAGAALDAPDREIRSEEHTSELQSLMRISYAVFCLKKKIKLYRITTTHLPTHNRSPHPTIGG